MLIINKYVCLWLVQFRCFCSSLVIWRCNLNIRQRTSIISVLSLSTLPPTTNARGASLVAKNGVSFSSTISFLTKFFGAGKCTVSPSKTCKNSHHGIREGFHLRSLSKTTSASSMPTHAKLPEAGLTKHS
jgi:hypothetical protein